MSRVDIGIADIEYARLLDEADAAFGAGDDLSGIFAAMQNLALSGYHPAMNCIANYYSVGTGVEKNTACAIEWWRRAAIGGDNVAMLNLGIFYRDELKNVRQARVWLHRALAAGDAGAHVELARLLVRCSIRRNYPTIRTHLMAALKEGLSGLSEAELESTKVLCIELGIE